MREEELRQVLLVKAMEETDPDGVLIARGDRVAASREAKRAVGAAEGSQDALLAARAEALLPRIVRRHAVVETVLALVSGPAWVRWLLIALSLMAGVGLSALDGTHRINLLSFPLLGLVLWNLAVYAAITIGAVRNSALAGRKRRWFSGLLAYVGVGQASRMVARTRAFDAPLSEALGRFTREWYEASKPLLLLRATRVLHLCAAAVGIGLIAGLYLRGIAFDYRAGWESTFLDPPQVRALLSVLYQPALTLTGITLPDSAHLATIRWRNGGGGESAARWIHLLAATTAAFVVAPRLLIALVATVGIRRLSLRAPVPPDFARYYRTVFAAAGSGERSVVRVVPYAYEPKPNTLARLRTLLAGEHADDLAVEVQPLVRYGDEEIFLASLRAREDTPPDTLVLLTSLAVTPEDENHGALIAEVRDWLAATSPHTQLLVVVDEGPYAGRMSSQGAALMRVDERRLAWREFISARGVEPRLADLSS
jgi:uncharacterized protein DUF2868